LRSCGGQLVSETFTDAPSQNEGVVARTRQGRMLPCQQAGDQNTCLKVRFTRTRRFRFAYLEVISKVVPKIWARTNSAMVDGIGGLEGSNWKKEGYLDRKSDATEGRRGSTQQTLQGENLLAGKHRIANKVLGLSKMCARLRAGGFRVRRKKSWGRTIECLAGRGKTQKSKSKDKL